MTSPWRMVTESARKQDEKDGGISSNCSSFIGGALVVRLAYREETERKQRDSFPCLLSRVPLASLDSSLELRESISKSSERGRAHTACLSVFFASSNSDETPFDEPKSIRMICAALATSNGCHQNVRYDAQTTFDNIET